MLTALLVFFYVLITITYLSLLERVLLAVLQQRIGPSRTFLSFLLQPIYDAVKLLMKSPVLAPSGDVKTLIGCLLLTNAPLFGVFYILPHPTATLTMYTRFDIIILTFLLALPPFCILLFSFFLKNDIAVAAAFRELFLTLSHNITIFFLLLIIFLQQGVLSLFLISNQGCSTFLLNLCFAPLMLFTVLGESGKVPYDVVESEAKLAAGFIVETSSMPMAFYVLGEYTRLLLSVSLFVTLLQGSLSLTNIFFFHIFITILLILVLILRAILPNFRFTSILNIHWKYIFLVLNFIMLLTFAVLLYL